MFDYLITFEFYASTFSAPNLEFEVVSGSLESCNPHCPNSNALVVILILIQNRDSSLTRPILSRVSTSRMLVQ